MTKFRKKAIVIENTTGNPLVDIMLDHDSLRVTKEYGRFRCLIPEDYHSVANVIEQYMKNKESEVAKEIDAFQYNGKNGFLIEQWSNRCVQSTGVPEGMLIIDTLEGKMTADENDWIIKEPFPNESGRTYYPCKPDIFEATYERVENE